MDHNNKHKTIKILIYDIMKLTFVISNLIECEHQKNDEIIINYFLDNNNNNNMNTRFFYLVKNLFRRIPQKIIFVIPLLPRNPQITFLPEKREGVSMHKYLENEKIFLKLLNNERVSDDDMTKIILFNVENYDMFSMSYIIDYLFNNYRY